MNYDFLQSYNIPIARRSTDNQYAGTNHSPMEGAYETYSMATAQDIPAINPAYYGYGGPNTYNEHSTAVGSSGNYYQNPERFIPPSKHGTGYVPQRTPFKRKISTGSGDSAAKKVPPIPEVSSDGKLLIFLGRDDSYPDELNSLIHPLSCDLCNLKMNSRMIAKDHYESKAHDKHISSWLFKNYSEKGINPPTVRRFIREGPTGPDAFYCEYCDLKLTSLTHANQHYAGKKHRMVIARRAKPSGAGFYNADGKWVRTGTKITPNQYKDKGFGIGEEFQFAKILKAVQSIDSAENPPSACTTTTSAADTTTTTIESEIKLISADNTKTALASSSDQDPALFCSICKVSVTSAVQMTMHLSGSKHTKKLKLAGLNLIPTDSIVESQTVIMPPTTITDNVLFSAIKDEAKPDPNDLSMYRTPSGQYYCKTCNTSVPHLPGLEQHLKGKRHLKKQTEDKALASLATKKTK